MERTVSKVMKKRAALLAVALTTATLAATLVAVAFAATPEAVSIGDPQPAAWHSTDLSLAISVPLSGDNNHDATASYRLRSAGDSSWPATWKDLGVSTEAATATAAGLSGGADYQVQVRVTDPDGIASAPSGADVSGDSATFEIDARTPRNMTYALSTEATTSLLGDTNDYRMAWPAGGDENGNAVDAYHIRPASDSDYTVEGTLGRTGGSLEATASHLLPGVSYAAYLSVVDPDGINGSVTDTSVATPEYFFTVSTKPVLLETPHFAPKPTAIHAWLPYSSDTNDNAEADMLLSSDGGSTWTRYAMARQPAASRFDYEAAGLPMDTEYLVAFDVRDPEGTAGTSSEDRFSVRTMKPWALLPLGTITSAGRDSRSPLATESYWWRSGSQNVSPLRLVAVSNNQYGILDFSGQWRVRPGGFQGRGLAAVPFSGDNGYLAVAGGNGTTDGDGWLGPFSVDRELSLGFRSVGRYTWDLELSGSGHYLDGDAFSLDTTLTASYATTVLCPNLSRRTYEP